MWDEVWMVGRHPDRFSSRSNSIPFFNDDFIKLITATNKMLETITNKQNHNKQNKNHYNYGLPDQLCYVTSSLLTRIF